MSTAVFAHQFEVYIVLALVLGNVKKKICALALVLGNIKKICAMITIIYEYHNYDDYCKHATC